MSKATKDRIVSFKIREIFLEMKWVTTVLSISLTTQTATDRLSDEREFQMLNLIQWNKLAVDENK